MECMDSPDEDFCEGAPLYRFDISGAVREVMGDIAFFWQPCGEPGNYSGFNFRVLECTRCGLDTASPWDSSECFALNVVWGWAAFDGVRHMHWSYIHDPDLPKLTLILQRLMALEKIYCNM